MKRSLSTLLILLGATFSVCAQGPTLSGSVVQEAAPISGANVFFLNNAGSVVSTAVTDDSGAFVMEIPEAQSGVVKVMYSGFETYTSDTLEIRSAYTMQAIVLHPLTGGALQGAVVRAQKPVFEARADRMIVNVANSITSVGDNVLEVLRKSPGVSVDQNDNIALKGRQGVLVYLDGKQVPLDGADLAALLQSLPANTVDKIELITNPGARYDAAGTAGIIQITTRKAPGAGLQGSVALDYMQGRYAKYGGSASLNYRNKRWSIYSSYSSSVRNGFNELTLERKFISPQGLDTLYLQHIYSHMQIQSHNLNAGVDYKLSDRTTVGLALNGGISKFQIGGSSTTGVVGPGNDILFQLFNTTDNANHWQQYAVNLNLRHKLDSLGRLLTVDADYARYPNNSDQQLQTSTLGLNGFPLRPDYLLWGEMDGYTDIRSLKADYEHPLPQSWKVDGGLKTSFVRADNFPIFYSNSSGVRDFDPGKSNHFVYDENINAAYVNTSKDWKQWSLQAGLRAEQSRIRGHEMLTDTAFKKDYAQLFPNIGLVRHLNASHDLGLTLSRRIERPNYRQLNPFRNYLDQSSIHQGNPNLDPSLTWSLELNHIYKGKFVTALNLSRSTDVITQVIKPGVDADGGKQTIITDDNLGSSTMLGLSGAYPLQPLKWWSSTNSFNVYYIRYEGALEHTQLSSSSVAFQLSTVNSITLPKNFNAEVNAWYQSRQVYGFMTLQPMYAVSIGLQKQFWDRRASVKITLSDLFRSMNPTGVSDFATYHEHFIVMRDTRYVGINLSYRFGKGQGVRQRAGGAADEKQRATAS